MSFIRFAVLVFVFIACTKNNSSFVVLNRSNQEIVHARVQISHQSTELKNIAPGKKAGGTFQPTGDSSYNISIEFKSGKKLNADIGYVTNGMRFQDEIIVGDSKIEISNKNKN